MFDSMFEEIWGFLGKSLKNVFNFFVSDYSASYDTF